MLEEFAEVAESLDLQRAEDPDRLQPERRAAQRRAGDRPRLLGRATCARRCASPTRSRPSPSRAPPPTWSSAPTRCSARWRASAWARTAQAAFVPTLREGRAEADAISTRDRPRPCRRGEARLGGLLRGHRRQAGAAADLSLPAQALLARLDAGARGTSAPIGQGDPEHPLLGATIEDPNDGGLTLTGRLSLATHPWLADHAVGGTVLLPGTAFLELALRAAEQVGRRERRGAHPAGAAGPPRVRSGGDSGLGLRLPTRTGGARSRSTPAPRAARGARRGLGLDPPRQGTLSAQSRSGARAPRRLAPRGRRADRGRLPLRPPRRARARVRPRLPGPERGLARRRAIYAEVSLPEEQGQAAERFGIHPALLDAALHGIALAAPRAGRAAAALLLARSLPAGRGRPGAAGEDRRRQRGRGLPALADSAGAPLATVEALSLRPPAQAQLQGAKPREGGSAGGPVGGGVLARAGCTAAGGRAPALPGRSRWRQADAARAAAHSALQAVQRWLADESKAESRLALDHPGRDGAAAMRRPTPPPRRSGAWSAPPSPSTPAASP